MRERALTSLDKLSFSNLLAMAGGGCRRSRLVEAGGGRRSGAVAWQARRRPAGEQTEARESNAIWPLLPPAGDGQAARSLRLPLAGRISPLVGGGGQETGETRRPHACQPTPPSHTCLVSVVRPVACVRVALCPWWWWLAWRAKAKKRRVGRVHAGPRQHETRPDSHNQGGTEAWHRAHLPLASGN